MYGMERYIVHSVDKGLVFRTWSRVTSMAFEGEIISVTHRIIILSRIYQKPLTMSPCPQYTCIAG